MVELKTLENDGKYDQTWKFGDFEFAYRNRLPCAEKREAAARLYAMRYREDEKLGIVYEVMDGFLGETYVTLKYFTNIDIDGALEHYTMDEIYDFLYPEFLQEFVLDLGGTERGIIEDMAYAIVEMRREVLSPLNKLYARACELIQMLPTLNEMNETMAKDHDINEQLMEILYRAKQHDAKQEEEKKARKMPKLNFAKR